MRRAPLGGTIALLLLFSSPAVAPATAQAPEYDWLGARYEMTLLDDGSDPWHLVSVEAGARRARFTAIARMSFASRFDARAVQGEIDLYPVWPGVGYAYLSAAVSAGTPFPDLRLAGEAYASLPRAFEASLGMMYMDFGSRDIPILTGSVGKYAGSYWFSLRPYWLHQQEEFAIALTARRYLGTADRFVTLRLVRGSAPETLETARDANRLASWSGIVDAQFNVAPRWLLLPLLAVTHEELPGRKRLRGTLGVGARFVF